MKFCELKEEEFLIFLNTHPLRSFDELPEMAHYKKNHGWDYVYVGMKEQEKIICGTLLLYQKKYFGYVFYSPHGFLIDYEDEILLKRFTKDIKTYIRKKKGYVLTIDPYFVLKKRDKNGNLLEENSSVIARLKKLGYHYLGTSSQVKYAFVLNLKEEIWNSLEPRTRSSIKESLKEGISTRKLKYEELSIFKTLTNSSSLKHHYQDRPLSYYEEMYHLFHKQGLIQFLVCEIDIPKYRFSIKQELKFLNEKQKKNQDTIDQIKKLQKKEQILNTLQKKYGNVVPLSGGMFFLYEGEITYLYSGNLEEAKFFSTSYRIQWEMIKYGIKTNQNLYNFYGILTWEKGKEGYSIYQFKKGFSGNIFEYVGEFTLPIKPFYYLSRICGKIKSLF